MNGDRGRSRCAIKLFLSSLNLQTQPPTGLRQPTFLTRHPEIRNQYSVRLFPNRQNGSVQDRLGRRFPPASLPCPSLSYRAQPSQRHRLAYPLQVMDHSSASRNGLLSQTIQAVAAWPGSLPETGRIENATQEVNTIIKARLHPNQPYSQAWCHYLRALPRPPCKPCVISPPCA